MPTLKEYIILPTSETLVKVAKFLVIFGIGIALGFYVKGKLERKKNI